MRSHGKPGFILSVRAGAACAWAACAWAACAWAAGCSQHDRPLDDGGAGGLFDAGTGGSTLESGGGAQETGGHAPNGGSPSGSSGAGGFASGGSALPSGGTGPESGGSSTSGGAAPMGCEPHDVILPVERLSTTRVSDLGVPFPTDEADLVGPEDWNAQYGKAPEIVPVSSPSGLDVLFQDQQSSEHAYMVSVRAEVDDEYAVSATYRIASLGRIMGFARDSAGHYFVATGVDEEDRVHATYPPNGIHRSNVVRIVKFDESGCVLMESDVDLQRGIADFRAEIIVNPMVASSSRLVWGDGRLLLVHGHNTEPDPSIDGVRHQKAISTFINDQDGTVTRTQTMWVSHSFDQRALFDGTGFVEMHLGDAFPRSITVGRFNDPMGAGGHHAFFIKGAEGANNTFTRLGSLAQTADPKYGLLALFATERIPDTSGDDLVQGTRDLALVRILNDFALKRTDEVIVDDGANSMSQRVVSAGNEVTNHLFWLTELEQEKNAERPRMVALESGELIVLFEQYGGRQFEGTFALRIDPSGTVLAGPTKVSDQHHLGRGDDIVAFGERAIYVTGGDGALHLNWVDAQLTFGRVSLQ